MNSTNNLGAIFDLDLESIKIKLMHKASGEGWTAEKADAVQLEYRRFLYLMKMFPGEQTTPSVDVDTFWHYHILDTVKYASDCEHVFGYFLHHNPYIGLLGEDGEQQRAAGASRMQELYEQTFNEALERAARYNDATANAPAYCAIAAAYCACTVSVDKHAA